MVKSVKRGRIPFDYFFTGLEGDDFFLLCSASARAFASAAFFAQGVPVAKLPFESLGHAIMNILRLFDFTVSRIVDYINDHIGYLPVIRAAMILSSISLIVSLFNTDIVSGFLSICVLIIAGYEFLYAKKVAEEYEGEL